MWPQMLYFVLSIIGVAMFVLLIRRASRKQMDRRDAP